MSKTTRATQTLEKAGITFTVHTYAYDPNAERVGRKGAPIAAAWSARASVKFENSTTSIGRGSPCSTARRKQ